MTSNQSDLDGQSGIDISMWLCEHFSSTVAAITITTAYQRSTIQDIVRHEVHVDSSQLLVLDLTPGWCDYDNKNVEGDCWWHELEMSSKIVVFRIHVPNFQHLVLRIYGSMLLNKLLLYSHGSMYTWQRLGGTPVMIRINSQEVTLRVSDVQENVGAD